MHGSEHHDAPKHEAGTVEKAVKEPGHFFTRTNALQSHG